MNKDKILNDRLNKQDIYMDDIDCIHKVGDQDVYPLTHTQQGIFFLQKLTPDSLAYNDITALYIDGLLHTKLLKQAIIMIIKKHEILQANFIQYGNKPIGMIIIPKEFILPIMAIEKKNDNYTQMAQDYIHTHMNKAFKLDKDNLLQCALLRLSENEHILIINIHHIIFDGWSKGIFLKEVKHNYENLSKDIYNESKLSYRYVDYVNWQKEYMQKDTYKRQLAYWHNKLNCLPQPIDLSMDNLLATQTGNGAIEIFDIDEEIVQSIKDMAKEYRVTPFIILLTVFKILLFRYTGETDILIGSPVAGRKLETFGDIIGPFVNMLVLRSKISEDVTFLNILDVVKKETFEAFKNQDVPFEKVIEELNPNRDLKHSSIFQIMFTMQNMDMPTESMDTLEIKPLAIDYGFAQVDLSLTIWKEKQRLKGSFEYDVGMFLPNTIKRMVKHYVNLLNAICRAPHKKIWEYNYLEHGEYSQLISQFNDTYCEQQDYQSVVHMLASSFVQYQNNIALYDKHHSYTYRQIDEASNKISHLLRKRGIKPNELVGIYMPNTFEYAVGILGILKAGGCFIPMDIAYPNERLESIINDTKMKVILTLASYSETLTLYEDKLIRLDKDWEIVDKEPRYPLEFVNRCNDLICIIYTSGTTGNPKGVQIEHGNIMNLIHSFITSYEVKAYDRILPLSSIASASYVGELLPLLTVGGSVVLMDKMNLLNTQEICNIISNYHVTILSTVPSMAVQLNTRAKSIQDIRLLLCGGETLNYHHVNNLIKKVTVVNGYGLTETSICSTYYVLSDKDKEKNSSVPVGKPIINNRIYIIDKYMKPVPIGCQGEIYIAGLGMTRGYMNDRELSSKKYIEDPFIKEEKMFRTGDHGLWLENGNIIFINRKDRQVQIHGYRIELGEIERQLGRHNKIEDIVVIDYKVAKDDRRIIAYIVPVDDEYINTSSLKMWLRKTLPDYMIPSHFEFIDKLPRNVNGKVDLQALPAPKLTRPELGIKFEMASTFLEKEIMVIWHQYLLIDKIGLKDNFFDLGGHSLLIMPICNDIEERLNKKIDIVDMFKYPTIYALAKHLEEQDDNKVTYDKVRNRALRQREKLFGKQ